MPLTRRRFLAATTALAALPHTALAAPRKDLTAAPATRQLAPEGYAATDVWAFNGQVPGEMLRYTQGDTLDVRLVNALEAQDTTIHWHGLRLPNAMDGVPDLTQAPVAPGETFDYRFKLNDAGTFWYHPHTNSAEQVSRGMAGVLVVEEPEAPDVDDDRVLVLDDWRIAEDAVIHPSFGAWHDMSHAGRLGNYITVNATPEHRQTVRPGTRLRLRLVNTATARIFDLRFRGLKAWVVAHDAMPLDTPERVDRVTLGPAQRTDLIVDITAEAGDEAILASVEREGTFALATFPVAGTAQRTRPAPLPLPPNDMPQIDLENARAVPLLMEGGAMRGLPEGGTYEGKKMDMGALADAGQFWAFNGQVGMGDTPLLAASMGETIRVPITNNTAFPHAMHLHGMHFREVFGEGFGPWRDTILVAPGETREVVFNAHNPGDWMFHCHMPSHQMSGMMNWIRVS
ncbi:multicopper oxidase family protein [Roseovarius sp. A21]|uniref:Multicopper oxidase family protein n=1 Tax=Roseovarius bejariae TaxID=2576383 RepID=A0A844CYJ8_9RHOB|nr:multicopper oxidase family protein [Roseovarius bejariae]MRU16176.1 multicopper oxidase family protein [Roseovarius bejariae]